LVDTLALPESLVSSVSADSSSQTDHHDATIVYSLRAATTGFPRAVREFNSHFTSGRDRLTAYSLLLC